MTNSHCLHIIQDDAMSIKIAPEWHKRLQNKITS